MATHANPYPKHPLGAPEMHEPKAQCPNRYQRHGQVVPRSVHREHGEQVGDQGDRDEHRDRGGQETGLVLPHGTDSDPTRGRHHGDPPEK